MEWLREWLRRDGKDTDGEDTVSRMPFIRRNTRSSNESGAEADDHQDSVNSNGGFWTSGNVLRKLTHPSPPLLSLTDPDKGEVASLRHRSELWTPDRGPGFYETQRARHAIPYLVTTGKHAGRSRVQFHGIEARALTYHVWKRDFFTSCINLTMPKATLLLVLLYMLSFFFWATVWWGLWRVKPHCVNNFKNYVSAFVFSVATQQTIGYGDISPSNCWASAVIITIQSIFALLLNAVVLGIVFARISRPGQRGRTIFLSDSAVIARRNGELKFMFRVADIRPLYQVVHPTLRAHLYTWDPANVTTEGEAIPVKVEELQLEYSEGMMLLPITAQHTIDERSPLWGHSHDSLQAAGAEVVVVFEGTSVNGNLFSVRQSYLPREVHWGYQFVQIIHTADTGSSQHIVDIARFHEVEPQSTVMELLRPGQLSRKVLVPPRGTIPASELTTNTLVVSDQLSVAEGRNGLRLAVRVGDTRPAQLRDVHVRMWLYRWHSRRSRGAPDGSHEPFDMHELSIDGPDRMCLRLPVIVSHHITAGSPLAHWADATGILDDADSEVVVMVEAVTYAGQRLAVRQRTYSILSDVQTDHRFATMVTHPGDTSDGHPHINWDHFHTMVKEEPTARHSPAAPAGMLSSERSISFKSLAKGGAAARAVLPSPPPSLTKASSRRPQPHVHRLIESLELDATARAREDDASYRARNDPTKNGQNRKSSGSSAEDTAFGSAFSGSGALGEGREAEESSGKPPASSSPTSGSSQDSPPASDTALRRVHSSAAAPALAHARDSCRAGRGRVEIANTSATKDSRRGNGGQSLPSRLRSSAGSLTDLQRGQAHSTSDTRGHDSSSSRSSRSRRSQVPLAAAIASRDATPTTTISAATLSDDPDTWHSTRALRNVYFPSTQQQSPFS